MIVIAHPYASGFDLKKLAAILISRFWSVEVLEMNPPKDSDPKYSSKNPLPLIPIIICGAACVLAINKTLKDKT